MEVVQAGALGRAAGVVEVGQGAGLQDRGGPGVTRDKAVGVARDDFRDTLDQVGWIEPEVAPFDKVTSGGGDSLGLSIVVIAVGRGVGPEVIGEWESFERR